MLMGSGSVTRDDVLVYNKSLNGMLSLSLDGTSPGGWPLMFESADCSGTAYTNSPFGANVVGTSLYMRTSDTAVTKDINSGRMHDGSCFANSVGSYTVYPAASVTPPFPLPIAGPIQIVP